jgi:hypothetical protein
MARAFTVALRHRYILTNCIGTVLTQLTLFCVILNLGGTAVQAVMAMEDTCISAAGAAGIVAMVVVAGVAAVKSTLTILRANRLD